jgi:hypothetical protein
MAFLSGVHCLLPVHTVNSIQTLKVLELGPVRAATDHELCHTLLNELKVVGVGLNTKVAASLKALALAHGVPLPPVLAELTATAPKHYNQGK